MAKAAEFRDMKVTELKESLAEMWRKQFKLKLLKASGELEKTHELRVVRRDIAKVLTVLAEKEGAE